MKVVILNGSYRRGGNTEVLSQIVYGYAKEMGNEVSIINVGSLENKVGGCANCNFCKNKKFKCAIEDETARMVESLLGYDVIILASPIYMAGVSSQMKAFIDRCHFLITSDEEGNLSSPLSKARFGIILSGGGDEVDSGIDGIRIAMNHFMSFLGVDRYDLFFRGGLHFENSNIEGDEGLKLGIKKFIFKLLEI